MRVREILESIFLTTALIGVVANAEILVDFTGYPRHRKNRLRVRAFLNYGG